MPAVSPLAHQRTMHNVALAYFSSRQNVSDAVRDLCTAQFIAEHINISFSALQHESEADTEQQSLPNAIGAHSPRWLLSRARAHDRHRSGVDQLHGRNPVPQEAFNPTCCTLDLDVALAAMAVPAPVIALLQKDMQHKGFFMLVDAPGRVPEACAIMDANFGYNRTDYLSA